MDLSAQVARLFLIAIPIACIAWTVTHEEIFKEPREYCIKRSTDAKTLIKRKFFYVFTCEYCFSHYVTILILLITDFKFLMDDWRGYLLAGFSLVWIANIYMGIFALIKVDIKKERLQYKNEEKKFNNEE
jgi:hypothetical protein